LRFCIIILLKNCSYIYSPIQQTDPKQQEAEDVLELAMEIIKERKLTELQHSRPDVVPSYIRNRPVPTHVDPRPRIGPLSQSGSYNDAFDSSQELYVDPSSETAYMSMSLGTHQEEGDYLDLANIEKPTTENEEEYLELQETREEFNKMSSPIDPDPFC